MDRNVIGAAEGEAWLCILDHTTKCVLAFKPIIFVQPPSQQCQVFSCVSLCWEPCFGKHRETTFPSSAQLSGSALGQLQQEKAGLESSSCSLLAVGNKQNDKEWPVIADCCSCAKFMAAASSESVFSSVCVSSNRNMFRVSPWGFVKRFLNIGLKI